MLTGLDWTTPGSHYPSLQFWPADEKTKPERRERSGQILISGPVDGPACGAKPCDCSPVLFLKSGLIHCFSRFDPRAALVGALLYCGGIDGGRWYLRENAGPWHTGTRTQPHRHTGLLLACCCPHEVPVLLALWTGEAKESRSLVMVARKVSLGCGRGPGRPNRTPPPMVSRPGGKEGQGVRMRASVV